ncbi:SulP family inorganic anion transporter [Congregibacter litoralis]|uniref:High affinity sulfate transporter 1 n=1 Tax=Congregibacter litoralis KT71 TaxID=314285 RepID=A4A353_9GAMM|nr:sulfate permease [Congregibacter litoralis]EAQ99120.1 high affinity sulfate transporter 1 [Congregibacter litoralis KT71]
MKPWLRNLLPPLDWLASYNREALASDSLAAVIVTIMLIPQSLAYALLAGLPAEMGLYASILPLLAYALFGSSRTLSVGPVAVVSLMTATAVGKIAATGSLGYASAAIAMALLSGMMLIGMGFLRFGYLANLLSHPVVSGFITASGIIIALSQLRHIFGIDAHGETLPTLLSTLFAHLPQFNTVTTITGLAALVFLFWVRSGLAPLLRSFGLSAGAASMLAKAGPVIVIIATTLASVIFAYEDLGVALVGVVPQGLPAFSLPAMDFELWSELAVSALLISVIGFVESVSVGKTLAAKRRQRIDANQELVALGAANVASAVSGGFPVTGGFSRSVVNFDAGAQTQLASVLTAVGIAAAALLLTPVLYFLPKATLAATIIVAVTSLIDFGLIKVAWNYSKSDFTAVMVTIVSTLFLGVELGVLAGIVASISLHLHKTSQPHIAIVGEVPGTEHFRNVNRHDVITHPSIVSLRIDESLYFANAGYMESAIYAVIAEHDADLKHIVLQCTAVNAIDLSALEALEAVTLRLKEQGIMLHLSEVKGPVMDALERTDFLEHLSGQVFLTQHQACEALKPAVCS